MSSRSSPIRGRVVGRQAFAVARPVFEATVAAEEILERARRKAEEILAEAHAKAEEVAAQARRMGYEDGLAQVTELLAAARRQAHDLRRQSEQRLVGLAVRIAERILGEQLQLAPETVVSVARQAMQQVDWCQKFVFRVHPDDLAHMERARESLLAAAGEVDIQFVADEAVSRGGCILETEVGRIDATLEAQLRAIERALATQTLADS